ncbi:hypothetical protein B0H14DRAFT_2580687 [Mycena olivaceomarginata]|nr:hypothetical protein B0H14DRAFT_2580687 [Mycena olivaceomarginata]
MGVFSTKIHTRIRGILVGTGTRIREYAYLRVFPRINPHGPERRMAMDLNLHFPNTAKPISERQTRDAEPHPGYGKTPTISNEDYLANHSRTGGKARATTWQTLTSTSVHTIRNSRYWLPLWHRDRLLASFDLCLGSGGIEVVALQAQPLFGFWGHRGRRLTRCELCLGSGGNEVVARQASTSVWVLGNRGRRLASFDLCLGSGGIEVVACTLRPLFGFWRQRGRRLASFDLCLGSGGQIEM